MIVVQIEVNKANKLEDLMWGDGLERFKAIRKELRDNIRLEEYIHDKFGNKPIDITEVNDFFWFEDDAVRKDLGLHYEGEDEDLDEENDRYNKRTHRRLHESTRRVPSHLCRFI